MSKTAQKVLQLFELIVATPGITREALQTQLALPQSTSYRLLETLMQMEMVEQRGKGFFVNQRLVVQILDHHSEEAQMKLQWQPVLEQLAHKVNYPIYLGRLQAGEVLLTQAVKPTKSTYALTPLATKLASYNSALGKCLLAFAPAKDVQALILRPQTRQTITERDHLQNQLAKIRRKGYATDFEEGELGQRCIAVPIFQVDGEHPVAAVAVANLPSNLPVAKRHELSVELQAVAAQLRNLL